MHKQEVGPRQFVMLGGVDIAPVRAALLKEWEYLWADKLKGMQ